MVFFLASSCGPLLQSVKSGDLELQLLLCSSVFRLNKMITVEYAEEASFFPQRVISWIASIAAMLYTSKELDDPPNGRFWTLSPDGDVHPESLKAPAAAELVWVDGRQQLILTTMMVAGHRLVRVYGFGAQNAQFFSLVVAVWAVFVDLETEVSCEKFETPGLPESPTPAAKPVSSPGRRIASELEELGPKVLAVEMKDYRERQSSPERSSGAAPARGQKK